VRYVLEGSVRKTKSQIRIIAQLIDATTGGHLWAEQAWHCKSDEVHKERDPIKDRAMLERHVAALHLAGLK
jgi:TolB-like protein